MKPRLLYSDVHFHSWDAFSTYDSEGVNTRLIGQIEQLDRAYSTLLAAGGSIAYCAGDLFHVRGKISPSVLNPVLGFYRKWHKLGVETYCISGNHDLETNDSTSSGSLITSLESVGVVAVTAENYVHEDVLMIPWMSSVSDLRKTLEHSASTKDASKLHVIIHAPLDGVLTGIPAHGLTADYLAKLGFKAVFCGHYHQHKSFGSAMFPQEVYSIGALTHQTWSDIGTKAGFIMLTDKGPIHHESTAPKFIELPGDQDEWADAVPGNYVRASIDDPTAEDLAEVRQLLIDMGAKGVLISAVVTKASTAGVRTSTVSLGTTEESVSEYADEQGGKVLATECLSILREVSSV